MNLKVGAMVVRPLTAALIVSLFAATTLTQGAAQSGSTLKQPVALTDVNVIDATGSPVKAGMTVLVVGGRIAAVERSTDVTIPAGTTVLKAAGKYVIPGLWDMHVHWYDERFLGLFIANGVTGVRQMWGFPLHLDWRTRIARGELMAPRFSIASAIVDGPNPVWPGSIVVSDATGAREAVREIQGKGYDFVKVYNRLSREAYFAIASEARSHGLPYAGHIPDSVSASEASDAGQKSIEHLDGILYAASSAEDELRRRRAALSKGGEALTGIDADTRTALREVRERLLATYNPAKAGVLFSQFAKNGTWQSPTLTVIRAIASLDDPSFTNDPRLKYMPLSIRDAWKPKNDPRIATKTPADYALDRRLFQQQLEIVGAMHRAGVRFLAGTDVLNPFAFPGFGLHDELSLLVEAGLSPMDALRAATIGPAEYLGTSGSIGTIEKGKIADLVLLDANPLTDIRNTRRIAAVVTGGRLVERAELDTMLAAAEKTASLKSIAEGLWQTIETQGIVAAVKRYRALKSSGADEYDFGEDELNGLGYKLLGLKRIDEAIETFKLNVEAYPQSANAYDSLGEAYMTGGNRDLAIQSYRRCLELDPRSSNAAQMLKKLGAAK